MENRMNAPAQHALRQRVSDLLDDFWEKIGTQHTGVSGRAYHEVSAEADLSTGAEGLRIEMDLPGMDEADIDISLRDRVLTISGEKRAERDVSDRTFLLTERAYGSFARSLRLPEGVDTDRLAASYGKGVLTVTAPLKAGVRPKKKIEIRSR